MDITVVRSSYIFLFFLFIGIRSASAQVSYFVEYKNKLFKVSDETVFTQDFGYLNLGDTIEGRILMVNTSTEKLEITGMYSGDEDLTIKGCPNTHPLPGDTTYTHFFFEHRGQRLALGSNLYFQFKGLPTKTIRFSCQLLPEDLIIKPGIFYFKDTQRKKSMKIGFVIENRSVQILSYDFGPKAPKKWKGGILKNGEVKKVKIKVPVMPDEKKIEVLLNIQYQSICCGPSIQIIRLPIIFYP